jgi:hypothetical protein
MVKIGWGRNVEPCKLYEIQSKYGERGRNIFIPFDD